VPEQHNGLQTAAIDVESLCRVAAASLPGGVLVIGPGGTIAFTNRQLERLFGYSQGDLIGQPVGKILPEGFDARAATYRGSDQGLPTEPRPSGGAPELSGRRQDGSRFRLDIRVNAVATEQGEFVVAAVNTTEGVETERDGLTVEEQLEFERVVADLTVKFINVPSERIDDTIREALQRIGETLEIDRCQLFRMKPDGMATDPVGWRSPGVGPPPSPVDTEAQFPCLSETLRSGRPVCFSTVDEIPNPVDRASCRAFGIRSSVAVPLKVGGRLVGAVGFNILREERAWPPDVVHRLRVFAAAFGSVLARRESEETLRNALTEVERLRDQLPAENLYLRREAQERLGTGNIVGQSAAIPRVLKQVRQVAPTNSTVLLLGETGTGKELLATRIHELSGRHARAMVRVNCSAIPSTLIESELFGREKGAFTGAMARQVGRFELADHSTIFLDEIGDLPADVQVKLLRVLEERQIERLGSAKSIHVDTRIIAATHRNLEQRIAEGSFREDLFYRLNVFPIQVPPLRERVEDIPLLVWRFVEEFSKTFGKRIDAIPHDNLAMLQRHSWPGNIRELRNIVERAMIVATGPRLTITLPTSTAAAGKRSTKLVDVEKDHIRSVLEGSGWRVRGVGGAADRLGLRPTTLETRMARLGIKRPES
jgi:formate hydrogenlyase transcriptional activator